MWILIVGILQRLPLEDYLFTFQHNLIYHGTWDLDVKLTYKSETSQHNIKPSGDNHGAEVNHPP